MAEQEKGIVGGTVQITDVEHVIVNDVKSLRPVNPPGAPNRELPGREF